MNKLERNSFIKMFKGVLLLFVILTSFNIHVYSQINPLQTLEFTNTAENINWNYNMGYRFRADKDLMVTQLGGRWRNDIEHKVRLYAYPSGTELAVTTVTGSMDWAYNDITPVALTAGKEYVVAVRLDRQNSGTRGNISMPKTMDGITILNSTYLGNSDKMPTNSITYRMFGFADITYEFCPSPGEITAANNQVLEGDSTELVVSNNGGSVQWQQSSNGVDFENIVGETHSILNTGPISGEVYYRTKLSGGCESTSNIVKVQSVDPFYPLKSIDPPVHREGVNWNYNMGYLFEVQQDGVISQLGGKWADEVEHTVRLYRYDSKEEIASVTIPGSMNWNYADITPINVIAGERYVVAVRLTSNKSGVYSILGSPVQASGIEIINSVYRARSNAMPTTVQNNYMFGMADIKFEPCSYAGKIFSDNDFIQFGDSSELSLAESIGDVQWQISSDGINFTDIPGAIGKGLRTGSLYQTTYYRTYVTSNGCGPDTSLIFPVRVFDPLHPLQSTNLEISGENINWNYNFGYRFSPSIDGNVTELGGRWKTGIEHTVRLYEYSSGKLMASANVVGNRDWVYVPISPVELKAGNQYVVAVRMTNKKSAIFTDSFTGPVVSGEITIETPVYAYATNSMPKTVSKNRMYGQPDFKFEPCVYAGIVKATPSIVCFGDSGLLEVNGSIGEIQWQMSSDKQNFLNIKNATDTVVSIPNLTETKYFRVISVSACGLDTSGIDSIEVPGSGMPKGIWLGLVDDDWMKGCNWGGGVIPETGDSVIIPSGNNPPVNNPVIELDYLVLANPNGLSLNNEITIAKQLILGSGSITMGNHNLILGENSSVEGGFSTSYIVANGTGKLIRKIDNAFATQTFPIGDQINFSPVSLGILSGEFEDNANLEINIHNTIHPLIGSPDDYVTRYVEINSTGVLSVNYDLEMNYLESDIVGNEDNIRPHFFNNDFWVESGIVHTFYNTFSFTGLTKFGSYTGSSVAPFVSAKSGNWNDGSTWFGNIVPTLETHSVVVSGGDTILMTNDVTLEKLSLESGAALKINGFKVDLKKGFDANGEFIGKGTMAFSGTELQNINGENFVFNNIEINNTEGVMFQTGAYGVNGTISIFSGTLFTNNALSLLSDETYTGSIGDLSNGDVVGNVRVERYANTYSKKWHFFSSPVAGSTFEQFNDDIITSGFPGSQYPSNSFTSIYSYNETISEDKNNGYEFPANITSSMEIGRGYWVWSQNPSGSSLDVQVDFVGEINKGNVSLPVTYTNSGSSEDDGWNLIGNPYPSAIDWDSPEWTKTNVDGAIYVYNPLLQQYTSYISGPTPGTGAGTNGGGRYIPSSQGFWVHATGANPSLIATEKTKVDTSAVFHKGSKNLANRSINITLIGQYGRDEMVVRFMENATEEYDVSMDAGKLFSSTKYVPSIYSLDGNERFYSINSQPLVKGKNFEIPFQTLTKYAGSFTLEFTGIKDMANEFCLFLKDTETDSIIDLVNSDSYTFNLKANRETPRFVILAQNGIKFKVEEPTCSGDQNGSIIFDEASKMSGTISWVSSTGEKEVLDLDMSTQSKIENLKSGTYQLSLTNSENNCGIDTMINLIEPNAVVARFKILDDTIQLDMNEKLELDNNSSNSTKYTWDFGDGQQSFDENPVHKYFMPGTYEIKLNAANEKGCTDTYMQKVVVTDKVLNKTELKNEKSASYLIDYNSVKVNFRNFGNETVSLNVYNSLGDVVLTESISLSGTNYHIINNHFSTGIYFIKLEGEDFRSVKKILFN